MRDLSFEANSSHFHIFVSNGTYRVPTALKITLRDTVASCNQICGLFATKKYNGVYDCTTINIIVLLIPTQYKTKSFSASVLLSVYPLFSLLALPQNGF